MPRTRVQSSATLAAAVSSQRPSSDLIQRALDWLFEQDETLAYDRQVGNLPADQAAAARQEG